MASSLWMSWPQLTTSLPRGEADSASRQKKGRIGTCACARGRAKQNPEAICTEVSKTDMLTALAWRPPSWKGRRNKGVEEVRRGLEGLRVEKAREGAKEGWRV
eukprot:358342-Chlamydomonas_euryale.AAC.1